MLILGKGFKLWMSKGVFFPHNTNNSAVEFKENIFIDILSFFLYATSPGLHYEMLLSSRGMFTLISSESFHNHGLLKWTSVRYS